MGREILFRGKRTDNGNWVEGHYFQNENGTFIFTFPYHANYAGIDVMVKVDPGTVGQYTGLTDKNGRRYEGDIFQASDGDYIQRYIIVWNEDSLEWSAECIGDPDGTLPLSEFRVSEIEVIGNIFDNPDLLEGGAE